MGWDAFGLPTEQYAIKTGKHPEETTKANVENFKHQLKKIGLCYDWNVKLTQLTLNISSGPNGYSFSYSKGLAYVEEKPVWFVLNWAQYSPMKKSYKPVKVLALKEGTTLLNVAYPTVGSTHN